MKALNYLLTFFFIISILSASVSAQTKILIGIYDSRAVAIAYGNSSEGKAKINELWAGLKNAKSTKNDSLIRRLKVRGVAYQTLAHLCAFSYGSVVEILEKHKAEVDSIEKSTHVQALVSRYELLQNTGTIETVDITNNLVQLFNPSEQVRQWIGEAAKQAPLPMVDVLSLPPGE